MNLSAYSNHSPATSHFVTFIAGLLLLIGPLSAHATSILVDFNDAGNAPTFGGTWNVIPDPDATTQLVDTTGILTNVNLSFDGTWFDSLHVSPWSHGDTGWIDGGAASDGLNHSSTSAPGHVVIAGLDTALLYRIDLLAAEFFGDPTGGEGDFSIAGSFGNSTPNGDNFNIHTDGLIDGNFMTWNLVSANASGEILVRVAGSNATDPPLLGDFVSAARITCFQRASDTGGLSETGCGEAVPVPEPGTLGLLAAGLVAGAAGWRHRRRSQA